MNFSGLWRPWLCTAVALGSFAARAATNDLQFGEVRVDPAARTISFPAQINQRTGPIEYLLVHQTGKVHESILKTAVVAQDIHAAALLFSEKASNTNSTLKLKVNAIEVLWREDNKEHKWQAADLIVDKKKKRPLHETKWAYRGSRLVDGIFLAQRDGSLIAIMEDREALIDQDTPDAADDENWEPVAERLPPIGTEAIVTIRFAFR